MERRYPGSGTGDSLGIIVVKLLKFWDTWNDLGADHVLISNSQNSDFVDIKPPSYMFSVDTYYIYDLGSAKVSRANVIRLH